MHRHSVGMRIQSETMWTETRPRQSIPWVHTPASLMAAEVRGSPAKWFLSICQKAEENGKLQEFRRG